MKALTGEVKTTATSFLTFVAVNKDGKPIPVSGVIPETEEEKKLFDSAKERYEARKIRKKRGMAKNEI